MSGTGMSFADVLPIPEKTNAVSDPDKEEVSQALDEGETASHALATTAQDDQAEKGAAQDQHDKEVKNLGWNEPQDKIPAPLVGGIGNEELWLLVRRFNKQMYHVKQTTKPVPGNLDLNIADEDEFSPDKLRSTLERLYMTVGIGMIGFGKHIVRLRSWREKRRTACFAAAYLVAWIFDLLVPLLASTIIALIVFPPGRSILFPPAPLALVSGSTGGVQKPAAGVLGSHDSATGAPENYKGEAVEQEAQNLVNSIAHVALSSATGKHPQGEQEEGEGAPGDSAPDPTAMAVSASNARVNAGSSDMPIEKIDKTKQPMEAQIWNKMRPIMHSLQDIADGWERFANALSPTAPFPQEPPRLRLASMVVPLLAISLIVTAYMFTKGVTFGIGFGFFGDPVITPGIKMLNEKFPNWQKLLEIRNTVLKGVPTNAQLTITLLRVGEANKAPLPPPPQDGEAPPDETARITEDDLASTGADAPLGASPEEIKKAASHDASAKAQVQSPDIAASKEKTHGKKGSRVLGFFKSSVKASVESAVGADHLKAKAGSSAAKNRLGVLPKPGADLVSGPVDFKGRFHGKKGSVYISTKATIPCVGFTTESNPEKLFSRDKDGGDQLRPLWSVAIGDIAGMKKIGGFGWKAKLVVGWALDRQVADGLEIETKGGETWKVTAMPLRDELFNRLIAMGGQKWESW